jgi:hypothetical protein
VSKARIAVAGQKSKDTISAWSLRSTVAEAMDALAERELAEAREADRWDQRGMFFTLVLLGLAVLLALAFGQVWVLLVGAAGGAVGRTIGSVPVRKPNSVGRSSWASTVLAAPVGAISAMAGLLLINVLISFELLNATTFDSFKTVTQPAGDSSTAPTYAGLILGVSFALGFVERLLTTLAMRTQTAFEPAEVGDDAAAIPETDDQEDEGAQKSEGAQEDEGAQTEPQAVPVIANVEPAEVPVAGGAEVSVRGEHLSGTTRVEVGGVVAAFDVVSDSEVTITTAPREVGEVRLTVTTPGGEASTTELTYVE